MYRIETYDEVIDQIAALPREGLLGYADAIGVLQLAPWSGEAYNPDKPNSAMRQLLFGRDGLGMVIYLVLEDDRRVDIDRVHWLD